jgi:hypothetical protein
MPTYDSLRFLKKRSLNGSAEGITGSLTDVRSAPLRDSTFRDGEACGVLHSRRRLIRFTTTVKSHRNGAFELPLEGGAFRGPRALRDLGSDPPEHSTDNLSPVVKTVPLDGSTTTRLPCPVVSPESETVGTVRGVLCCHHHTHPRTRPPLSYGESGSELGRRYAFRPASGNVSSAVRQWTLLPATEPANTNLKSFPSRA